MPRPLAKRLFVLLALAVTAALVGAASAAAAPHVDGTFPLSSELEANNKIAAGPDGNVWVTVVSATNDVARVTPAGAVTEYDLENVSSPSGIAAGPDGMIWVTQNEGVAAFSPSQPTKTKTQSIAQVKAGASIVAGPDGNMWVATEGFAIKVPPANPATFTAIPIAGLVPKDIDVAGSVLAISDFERILTLTTAGTETSFKIPGSSQGVAGAPNGQIAYSDPLASPEQIGYFTPPAQPKTIELLGDPFGVAYGADQAFWVVQFAKGGLTRLAPSGETSFLGGLPIESARQITAGPNHTLWVTLTKNAVQKVEPSIARISGVGEEPVPPVPNTIITKGPRKVRTHEKRAKVRFRFKSTIADSSFECALNRVRKGKKQAKPSFKACKSPRTFHLRPGRYRFAVRALAAGKVDPTPAKRSFRVVRVPEHRRKHR